MKKTTLTNIGGIILFYSIIIVGILLLNCRFEHLNNINNSKNNDNYIAINH